ncbi:neutral/alkaline non-lysosomal ceramidase N-terminal domain-containing protein [Pricia sp. S334]|uniref:Neutral/alkaline non-lysosomal ceramidase N-terminal domain-containing protein n=1 Tax=Pricia mediterranea TaxID=3076079 RepID=A0ABU3L4Z2_9FLAO|nr:neutral/alkaline non-lysosomal ceramidase N-terminal domain-containing protein [Pricia sp. S334]MDT7828814.1 neutral/alkaline non-lysosomal ceramidase N-terminal domain-containing protein [Pricia sp. S334]
MRTKRWQRRVLRTVGILAVMLGLLFYFAADTIETDPYFESGYYKITLAKVDDAFQEKIEAQGQFLAGFARMNITPKYVKDSPDAAKGEFSSIKLAGYGDGQIAVGVHDSLFAKAIALEVDGNELIFLSADMVVIPELVVLEVESNLDSEIARAQILYGATHTHASIGNCIPGFVGESFMGDFQPEVVEWLGKKFTQLILNARKDRKPARFSSGDIRVPNLIRNRIIGETGRLNDKLNVATFAQHEGKKAAIGIFGAHATTIGPWNDKFSGDYPGYFQRSLEAKGIDLALFFAGTVGSHSNKGKGEKFQKSRYIGETLADSASVLINKMEADSILAMTVITTEIEIPELQAFYVSDRLRLSPWAGGKMMAEMKSIYLQGVKLNDLLWITMPYELSGEYGIDLKNALEVAGYNSALTSFNGQYLGYIVPQKYYYYDTYEARLMGWYGPSMGDYLMELNFRLANELTDSRL